MFRLDRPRILLVSIGMYGQKYLAEATQKDVGGDVAGVVDVAPDLEEKFPVLREKGIPVYRSLKDFYQEDHADLAVISSPIHLHVPMALECLRQGSHVLCEKPLCLTEGETEALSAAAKAAGRFLAVGWQMDYDPAVLALKRDILAGRFGAPLRFRCVHAMRRGESYYARNNWAGKITADRREVLDSPFMNACAHQFQLITFLLGPEMSLPVSLKSGEGQLFRGNPHVENYDIAALRFLTDRDTPLLYYTAHPLKTKNLGQMGRGEFEHAVLTWENGEPFRVITDTGEEILYGQDGGAPMIKKLYDAVDCARRGGAPLCGPFAGLSHLRAVRMAQTLPIRDVPSQQVEWMELEGERVPCVKGLEETFLRCAESWALPKELGLTV